LAARKLHPGGRLGLQAIEPGRLYDPALPRPLAADYLAFTLQSAGFEQPRVTSAGEAYVLTTTLSS
ncbi:MAG TPA: hypothetical protein VF160_07695, partial [Candidatus Dormibacteraeota bacterium]